MGTTTDGCMKIIVEKFIDLYSLDRPWNLLSSYVQFFTFDTLLFLN